MAAPRRDPVSGWRQGYKSLRSLNHSKGPRRSGQRGPGPGNTVQLPGVPAPGSHPWQGPWEAATGHSAPPGVSLQSQRPAGRGMPVARSVRAPLPALRSRMASLAPWGPGPSRGTAPSALCVSHPETLVALPLSPAPGWCGARRKHNSCLSSLTTDTTQEGN